MKKFHKTLSALMAGALTVSAVSLSGCRKEEKTTEESSIVTTAEPTEEEVLEDEAPVVEMNNTVTLTPTEKEALDLAEKLGVSMDEIHGEYELFIRYANIVMNNPKLNDYRAYALHLFPVVADHYNEETLEYFLEKLSDLTIENMVLEESSGEFYELDDRIWIDSEGGIYENEECYTTVFHELLHFTDAFLDGENRCNLYYTGERIAKEEDLTPKEWEEIVGIVSTNFITEGGAELYQAKYYSKTPITYSCQTAFLTGLEHIYGSETLDSLFFRSDSDMLFVELLREAGYDDPKIYEVITSFNYYTSGKGDVPKTNVRLEDVLIDLYEHVKGPSWQEDKVFGYILRQINSQFFDYVGCEHKALLNYMATSSDMWEITESILDQLDQGSNPSVLSTLSVIYLDGKPYLTTILQRPENIDHSVATAIIIDYDFEEEKVLSYQYLVHSYPSAIPGALTAGKELDERLESLKRDTTYLHEQEAYTVKSKEMQELYDRAAEIGNKYGVYIRLEETLPSSIDQSEVGSCKVKEMNEALDRVEAILEMFPKGYFDNFCYGYFTGFEIDLVRRPQSYTELRCSPQEGGYLFSIILEANGDEPEEQIDGKLLDAILSATEMRLRNYYENFENPFFTEDKWMSMNADGFRYFGYQHEEDEECDYGRFKEYVVSFDSMRMPSRDRVLLLKALLLQTEISDACLEKAEYLCECIREAFDSENWPDQTAWEKEIERQKTDHAAKAT
ncbi:MAG: hypothetical protein J5607_02175 [Clostridiales bacterium]|nr:hypothetical protein [Clostridiales bacterium]